MKKGLSSMFVFLIVLLVIFSPLFLNSLNLSASVGIGYSEGLTTCILAKKYYIDSGCTCPSDQWNCNYYSDKSEYVIHCSGCPSSIGAEIPHYSLGSCFHSPDLCVDAESLGLLSCDGEWSCIDFGCVCDENSPLVTTVVTTTGDSQFVPSATTVPLGSHYDDRSFFEKVFYGIVSFIKGVFNSILGG